MSAHFANIKPLTARDNGNSGKPSQEKILHISMNAVALKIANTRTDGTIRVWKSVQGLSDQVTIKSGYAEPVRRISWLPTTDNRFASVGGDGFLKLWTAGGVLEREIQVEKGEEKYRLVDYSVDGQFLTLTDGNRLVVLDVNDEYKKIHEIELSSEITEVRWLHDPLTVFVGLENGQIEILQVKESLDKAFTIYGPRLSVTSIAIDPKGKFFCAGCEEGAVYFWRTSDLQNSKALTKIDEAVSCVDISRDGSFVAVSYVKDSNIRIFDSETLEQMHEVTDSSLKNLGNSQLRWLPNVTGYIYTTNQNLVMTYAKKLQ
ncbi:hypothetical protein C7M61_003176 [Candidozyma pseudohaemuli]|uniref:Uncharacterized protein n=1 Tax=Candidozyma pseudohaemuli TaxID=418784 RepID=A0A2P7YPN1_9ASCO|nr:hypothetical protein C7M61_003176 [[Candida] pseudohaemulonii]PSK37925.1 hypothetical protein C7M61_003176 [[Candida] pseudohaemulonii]